MLKQVQHDIFHHFPNYDTVSSGEREGVRGKILEENSQNLYERI
jgi:hypothetical protein